MQKMPFFQWNVCHKRTWHKYSWNEYLCYRPTCYRHFQLYLHWLPTLPGSNTRSHFRYLSPLSWCNQLPINHAITNILQYPTAVTWTVHEHQSSPWTSFSSHSFCHAVPAIWNSLSFAVTNKYHLFRCKSATWKLICIVGEVQVTVKMEGCQLQ